MIVAVIVLAAVLAGALGVIVWLVYNGDKRTDQTIATFGVVGELRAHVNKLTLDSERAKYEARVATGALHAERKRADALEEFISHEALETDPAAALAPDDVAGRLLRFSRTVGDRAEAAGGDLPAGPDALMRPDEG